jgi:hypothetical protein
MISSIKLPAHPEAFALETGGTRILVNIPNARQVAVADRNKGEVVASWKTDWAFANFPMALDGEHHRLFIGCRMPTRLVVLDTDTGKPVAKLPIGGDTDDVFYDRKRHQLYVVCGAGTIEIIAQSDADTYAPVSSITTNEGARTGFFVPEQDLLFVAVPHRGNQPAEVRSYTIK